MLIYNENYLFVLLTTHLPLKKVSKILLKNKIEKIKVN